MKNLGERISTLWIVVMFTMVFADIVGMMMPGVLQAMMTGQVGVPVTQGVLLVFAVLLQIPIAMIYLSRVLKPRANRWANTAAAILTAAFVIGGGSPYLHYYFFATVEVAFMGLIVWSVWSRRSLEATEMRPVGQQARPDTHMGQPSTQGIEPSATR